MQNTRHSPASDVEFDEMNGYLFDDTTPVDCPFAPSADASPEDPEFDTPVVEADGTVTWVRGERFVPKARGLWLSEGGWFD